jgi:iron-sulfur cluster assembly accessory protein
MIQFSPKAVARMAHLGKNLIYVGIEPGGCAEFKYYFSFALPEEEIVFYEFKGIKAAVSKKNADKLGEVEIDYKESLMRKCFYIASNPYVIKQCPCGISFAGKID